MMSFLRATTAGLLLMAGNSVWADVDTTAGAWQCPEIFQHDMKQLHSSKVLNLCDVVAGKPVLLVNTASHCGFTKQFGDLEAIHQKYKDEGLVVMGVSSDSFNQEAESEEKAAEICFKNFGVSFTMLATVPVRGDEAHPLFKEVAEQDTAPKWNFYKYLINTQGQVVSSNSSMTLPDDDDIQALLAGS
ncbi:glutathione peroxidase [Bacterioplanes sanyensis]|uniref:Glutathione peroxidase n=1 Tax=Bacterioplanes sanyensis TaxID=1249553 RepID=A0A222FN44_9GAMM|nr:glutathione peroxidase [Bacterioplanes sanyensis]ASP40179.1 glutathione peroxidase [Bacterioplanes sanyensis]